MARERYLVGIDPEELKPRKHEPTPQTPRSKWENFWYYHKWKVVVVAFILLAAGFILYQYISRTEPDYTLILVTEKQMTQNSIELFRSGLEAVGEDLNGDGEVYVRIAEVYFSSETDAGARSAGAASLMVHLASGDALLFAFEPSYYETYALSEEGVSFTALLPEGQGVSADGHYWNWIDGKARRLMQDFDDDMLKQGYNIYTPTDLYFCVRRAEGTAAEQQTLFEQSMALLDAYRADNDTSVSE